MVLGVDDDKIAVADCTTAGCKKGNLPKTLPLFLVRPPSTLPDREKIVTEALKFTTYLIEKKKMDYPKSYRDVGHYLRPIVGRCMGRVGWSDLVLYMKAFLVPYIKQQDLDTGTYLVLCSQFVLWVYQLAALKVWSVDQKIPIPEVVGRMQTYFPLRPQYCRPYPILLLSTLDKSTLDQGWTVYRMR